MTEFPRAATWAVLLLVAACGGEPSTTLGASTPTARATVATPTASPASTPAVATTARASAGTGQASIAGASSPGGPPRTTSPATIRPTAGTTTVSDDDSGSTVHLHTGDRLQVHLTQGSYDPPVSSSGALVRRSSSGGYPTAQPITAVFEAVTHGVADISTTSDAACFHTEPRCMMPTREWIVHVTVS